jgi:arabinofuranosyltransferase
MISCSGQAARYSCWRGSKRGSLLLSFSTLEANHIMAESLLKSRSDSTWLIAGTPLHVVLLLGLSIGLLFHQQMLYYGFYIDDSYISLVYVRNFLEGRGLTYNGLVVEGYSNFLWVLLLILAGLAGADLVVASKWLGIIFSQLTLALLLRFGYELSGRWREGFLAGMILVVTGPFVAWSVGGLEAAMFGFLLLLMVYLLHREAIRSSAVFPWSGVAALLLALTRPEGIGLVAVAALWVAGIHLRDIYQGQPNSSSFSQAGASAVKEFMTYLLAPRARYRESGQFAYLVNWIVIIFTGYALFLGWRLYYYEDLLPATVYAKSSPLMEQITTGLLRMRPLISEWSLIFWSMPIVLLGLFLSRKNRWETTSLMVGVVAAYAFFVVVSGGDWMPMYRFLVPIIPLAALLVVVGISFLVERSLIDARARYQLIVLVILLSLPIGQLYRWTVERHESAVYNAQITYLEPSMIGKLLAEVANDSSSIAVIDAGAIAYYSKIPVLDMVGLNNQHIAKLPGRFSWRCDNNYILNQKPTWIQVHFYLTEQGNPIFIDFGCTAGLYYSQEFQQWYEMGEHSVYPRLFQRQPFPKESTSMDDFYRYRIEVNGIPGIISQDTQSEVTVRVTNAGTGIWTSSSEYHVGVVYILTSFVESDSGHVSTETLTPLREDIYPGYTQEVQVSLPRVSGSGTYTMRVDLVHLGLTSFGNKYQDAIWEQIVVVQ